MLLPRLLTVFLGIPLILLLIHWGSIPFLALVVGAAALALHEYGLILWMGGRGVQRGILTVGGGLLALSVALGAPGGGAAARGSLSSLALTAIILAAMLREMFRREHSIDRVALTVFGTLFIGWTLAHLALLRDLRPYGERLTFLLFGTIWATDIVAYAVGKTVGDRRLAPVISPKKTWEGAAGGFLAAVVFAFLAHKLFLSEVLSLRECLGLGAMIGVFGQLSDLAESVIKRAAGVKDSSHLLPGHGGILDRFDSFLLTAPLMYYALCLKFTP